MNDMKKKRFTAVKTAAILALFICLLALVPRFFYSDGSDGEVTDSIIVGVSETAGAIDTLNVTDAIASDGAGGGEDTASDETAAAEADEASRSETRISFLGVGDNIIYRGNVRDAQRHADEGEEYDFGYVYDPIADMIEGAGLAFINQETLMCGDDKYALSYYPCFNSPQQLGRDICELGFDVVNIANNHMLDKSSSGLAACIEFWKEMPVLMIGGNENFDDYRDIRVWKGDGISVAFLSYTYGTNGIVLPANSELYIPYLDSADIPSEVAAAKELADLVFVSVHWGIENSFVPSADQRRYAQLMADSGADVIIGHHPHVIQPVEWIEGSGGSSTLCIYSLGNIMAMMADDYNLVGGIVTFDMVKNGSEDAYIDPQTVLFTPTLFNFPSNFRNIEVLPLSQATAGMVSSLGLSYYGHSTTLSKLYGYVTSTVAEEFLPDDFLAAAEALK